MKDIAKIAAILTVIVMTVCSITVLDSADAADETESVELTPIDLNQTYLDSIGISVGRYNLDGNNAYTLKESLDLGSYYLYIKGTCSLDLNGYSITSSAENTINVRNTMTITDSSGGNGAVISTYTGTSSYTGAVTNFGTLTIEGGSFKGNTAIKMNQASNGTLNINGGTFEGNECIVINSGNATLTNGTFTGGDVAVLCRNNSTYSLDVHIEGGNYTADAGVVIMGKSSQTTSLTVSGGTITGTNYGISGNGSNDNTSITVEGGEITATNAAGIYHPQVGDLTVNGGTITGYTGIQFCGTGNITITGGTITGNGEYNPTSKGTSDTSGTFDDGAALSVISRGEVYQSGGKVAVEITGGNLVSEKASAVQTYRIAVSDEDKWVTGDDTKLESYVGSVEITGGTFESPTGTEPISYDESKESKGVYTIIGGTFSDTVDQQLIKEGYSQGDGGTVTVTDPDAVVAQIERDGSVISEFLSLEDAIDAAQDGDTVVLLEDRNESVTIDGKSIILDLNDNTLTNTEGADTITVETGASLTVQDSSGDNSGTVDNTSNGKAAVLNYGTFILESGTLTRSVEAEGNSYYVFENLGTATISGGIIKANTGNSSLACNSNETQAATMTIEGGHIEQLSNGIAVKNDELGTLSITGGTIIGTGTAGQAVQNWNVATISDGDLTGDVTTWNYLNGGVSTKSQTTISGEAHIEGDVYSMKYVNDVTTDYDLSMIENPDVRITGGMITGSLVTGVGDSNKDHDWQVLTPTADEDYDWMDVSGGSFTNMVEDRFLAEGHALSGGGDSYGVVEGYEVHISHNPENAVTTLTNSDGTKFVVEGAGTITLAPGVYDVLITAEGYYDYTGTYTVDKDNDWGEALLSKEKYRAVTITVTPSDALVDVMQGNSVVEQVEGSGTVYLEPGTYILDFIHDDYSLDCVEIVVGDQDMSLSYEMVADAGRLDVDIVTNVSSSVTIIYDSDWNTIGGFIGSDTVVLDVGQTYMYACTADGYNTSSGSFTVSEGMDDVRITLASDASSEIPSIDAEGDDVTIVLDGTFVPVSSEGDFNATVNIILEDMEMTIEGSFESGTTFIQVYPLTGSDVLFDYAYEISTPLSEITQITVSVPVDVADGQRLVDASVYREGDDGSLKEIERVSIDGDVVTFVTTENSHYHIDAVFETTGGDSGFPPFIPGDDDDVYIPPTIVVDESSSDDDESVKIAACAAAAVAAAILACLIIMERRKG